MTTIQQATTYSKSTSPVGDAMPGAVPGESPLLPEPDDALAATGDPVAALAALAVKTGDTERHNADEVRSDQRQIEQTQDNLEVQAMRQKADDIRSSGWVEGAGMMAGAGLSFAAADDVTASGAPTPDGTRLQASSKMMGALVEIRSEASKASEADDDATAAAHRAASDQAKTTADDAHDAKKDASDLISAALDFYREYSSGKATERNATLQRS